MTDDELLRAFEDRMLPFNLWTHRTHVRIAFLYLRECSFDDALDRMRRGIWAYNEANDVPEGPWTGYHETTTHAFLHLIRATMDAHGEALPTPDGESFCDTHTHLMSKHLLRLFYSPEHRMRPEAKERYLPPDLTPLPPRSS